MGFENVKFNCIKGIPISSVEPRMLAEMGFPVDVPPQPDMCLNIHFMNYVDKIYHSPFPLDCTVDRFYINALLETRSREKAFEKTLLALESTNITVDELAVGLQSNCLYTLEASDVETLIEGFIFIINELLPRQASDIFYSFDIEPNPAYFIFFNIAAERLNLLRYDDQNDPRYGQFIGFTEEGVKARIAKGESLISIYKNTCATKEIIKDAHSDMPHTTLDSIEAMLFSLSKHYHYVRNEPSDEDCEFFLYKDGEKILNIAFLCEDELDHIDDYGKYISEIRTDDKPLLVLDHYETYTGYLSTEIRKALKDPAYVAEHTQMRSRCFKYEKAIRNSDHNYKFAKTAKLCRCLSCGAVFTPQEITEWYFYDDAKEDGYASCPKCGEEYVIMDSQGYEVSEDYMDELIEYIEKRDSFDDSFDDY